MEAKAKTSVYPLAMTAVMAAVTCVLGPMSIQFPFSPVPVSLTILAVYLALYLVGWKRGTVSTLVYILIGMVGMPVFSNYSGGLAKLAGPTGGYIIGFIPMAILAGVVIDKFQNRGVQFVGMVAGVAVCYVFGTAWFCLQGGYELSYAMSACVVPFIPFDLVKIVIAMLVGPTLRSRLEQAGIHPAG